MKKILSIAISIIMICSAVLCVNAAENDRFTKKKYSSTGRIVYTDTLTDIQYTLIAEGVDKDEESFLLVQSSKAVCDEMFYKTVGKYLVRCSSSISGSIYHDDSPYWVIKNNDVAEISYAVDNGWLSDDDFCDAMKKTSSGNRISLLGDVNEDNDVNILDATEIQKNIVFEKNIFTANTPRPILDKIAVTSDFNEDGNVNIRDVTCIQKRIAGLM